jgi:ParB family chromosome partitioning protein
MGLAQSMRDIGQQEPIHVMPLGGGLYSLITGGRRVRVGRKSGWLTIDAIIESGELSKSEILLRQIIENAQREDLTPLEKAKAIDLLMKETGWTASQTAAKLGFSNSTLTKLLSLTSLAEPIQQLVQNCEIPATAAYELSRVSDVAQQEELARQVAGGELTRDGLSGAIKARKRSKGRSPSTRAIRITAKLSGKRSVTVSGAALTMESYVATLEELLVRAREAQSEGLELVTFCGKMRDESRRN